MKASRFSKFRIRSFRESSQEIIGRGVVKGNPFSSTHPHGVQVWYELKYGKIYAKLQDSEVVYSGEGKRSFRASLESLEYWSPKRYVGYLNWMSVLLV